MYEPARTSCGRDYKAVLPGYWDLTSAELLPRTGKGVEVYVFITFKKFTVKLLTLTGKTAHGITHWVPLTLICGYEL